MPEPSHSDREKAARLPSWLAQTRLVQSVELRWEVHFRCQFCGAAKTWRRDVMLGRLRPALNATFAQIHKKTRCPRCGGALPIMSVTGVRDPGPMAAGWRRALVEELIDLGLNPADYGYGLRPRGDG